MLEKVRVQSYFWIDRKIMLLFSCYGSRKSVVQNGIGVVDMVGDVVIECT